MPINIIVYAVILAIINYPFVLGMDLYLRTRSGGRVFDMREPSGQRARELRNSYLTTPVHALLFVAFIGIGLLRTQPESLTLVTVTFITAFLWTEIWHYISHVAMHTKPLHFIHKEHHLSRLTGPWTSVSFSFLEKFIFSFGILGGMALISRFHPLSAFGVFGYYVLYFYTNTLGHSNYEFRKAGYYGRVMGRLFNSPTFHTLHHARYVRNYGLITPWLDRLFRTAWIDVAEVQTRAASGAPLLRLAEKCDTVK